MYKIILEIIPSVITGTIVYAITKFIIDSLIEIRKVKGDVSYCLFYYANVYGTTSIKDQKIKLEASYKFRHLAAQLTEIINRKIPFYNLLSNICMAVPIDNIEESVKLLTYLHNSILTYSTLEEGRENRKEAEKIKTLLNLKGDY